MTIKKVFGELTNKELWEIAILRSSVFTIEQNIKENELEELDYKAIHYFIKKNNVVVSYARVIQENEKIKLGRVCTKLDYRGQGLQTKIIRTIIDEHKEVELSAQIQTISFYQTLGFETIGDIYLEANIKHQRMIIKVGE